MTVAYDLPTIPMDDAAFWQDPYPLLGELRDRHRLAQTPSGVLAVLRWDDAFETVRGNQFVQEGIEALERRGFRPGDPLHTWGKNRIGVLEGAEHRRVRSLASSALTMRRMEPLRPLIRRHANALLDKVIESGQMEGLVDYALPLPRVVMMEFLGISEEEWDQSGLGGGSSVIDAFGPDEIAPEMREKVNHYIQSSMEHTLKLYERRRQEPRDDLLTHLAQAQDEQGRLSDGELITLFSSIFGAGSSTSSVIASGLFELTRRPEQAELLRNDPEGLKRGASEETLRYRPAINDIKKKAAEDTRAFDLDFPKDAILTVILGAANRDPQRWEDPERYDIRRNPEDNSLTFGIGPHVCLGHAMARATIEEALATFVQRCDEIEVQEDPRWKPFVMENRLEGLRLGFRAAERASA